MSALHKAVTQLAIDHMSMRDHAALKVVLDEVSALERRLEDAQDALARLHLASTEFRDKVIREEGPWPAIQDYQDTLATALTNAEKNL